MDQISHKVFKQNYGCHVIKIILQFVTSEICRNPEGKQKNGDSYFMRPRIQSHKVHLNKDPIYLYIFLFLGKADSLAKRVQVLEETIGNATETLKELEARVRLV